MDKKAIVTYITIILTIIAYGLQSTILNTSIYGLNSNFLLGAYWQPLSTMFMHGNISHLAMNMIVLFQLGSLMERARGGLYFALIYYVGGIATSLLTFCYIYYTNSNVNVIGASGAICALIGWVAQKVPSQRKGLVAYILLISIGPLLLNLNVAWYGHLIGFCVGFVIAKIFK